MKFSKMYTKFKQDKFTTIRKHSNHYVVGRVIKVVTPEGMFKARVTKRDGLTKQGITDELAMSDADCSREELIEILNRWYGKKHNDYVLIHLERVNE